MLTMTEEKTRYGTLKGVVQPAFYEDGTMKWCTLVVPNTIQTRYGALVPQYEDDGLRRKFNRSLTFHPNGMLRSISLQEQTAFETPQGSMPAEQVTFYEDGAIHRFFPLNGKLSGFWSEKSEYEMEPVLHVEAGALKVDSKLVGITFYPGGKVYSLTLFPRDALTVALPFGGAAVRMGISFYEDGSVKSLEPRKPIPVPTPVGELVAFNPDAYGITGDVNSLRFAPDGSVSALVTGESTVTVRRPDGSEVFCTPSLEESHFEDDVRRIEPMTVRFENGMAVFPQGSFSLAECTFTVGSLQTGSAKVSNDCTGCGS